MRHYLRRGARTGKVKAGKLFMKREIARRTGIPSATVGTVIDSFYDLAWSVLIGGYRLKIGPLGDFGVCPRRCGGPHPDDPDQRQPTAPWLDLRGRMTDGAKLAWYRHNGHGDGKGRVDDCEDDDAPEGWLEGEDEEGEEIEDQWLED